MQEQNYQKTFSEDNPYNQMWIKIINELTDTLGGIVSKIYDMFYSVISKVLELLRSIIDIMKVEYNKDELLTYYVDKQDWNSSFLRINQLVNTKGYCSTKVQYHARSRC